MEVIEDIKKKVLPVVSIGCTINWSPINLHIYSPGGSIFAAFSFIDFMKIVKRNNSEIRFHTIVTGGTASAGTLISVHGDKRYITEYGYMLIHQLNGMHWGKYNELKDDMTNSKKLMKRIREIYKKYTKIPEEQLNNILEHDLYWDAQKCLKMGLVDEII